MRMTPEQLKEALTRRVQYGEMSPVLCDSACETIDGMMDIIRRTAAIVDPDCPDIDAYVDGHCGLPEAVERMKANVPHEPRRRYRVALDGVVGQSGGDE